MATVALAKENIKTNKADLTKSTVVVPVCHDCGCDYGEIFACTRYGKNYGPTYSGDMPLSNYPRWAQLVKDGRATEEEKRIVCRMSPNEGNLDAIQAYDSEALTAGAMQKTINSEGFGQFPELVNKFKEKKPDLYKSLFENCGWTVEIESSNARMYWNKLTAKELKSALRDPKNYNAITYKKTDKYESKPLAAILKAIKHDDFMDFQVDDFIQQLREVLAKKVTLDNKKYPISSIVKSELGRATVLDQYVNRPALVASDLKKSILAFLLKHRDVKSDPATWGENHAKYEAEFIEHYGNHRQGTDMVKRFKKLKG
ncbi:hypothetical protein PWG14_17995 (plasmid) [Chromobacterium amazonense]|uniref:hypothetical protein n=1 Tax=Chromobacterium amazonense TaxID=1382803 RepID=UPI00237D37CE|nr:hypothetical protein [Chromobacterium amazonense]MDE1714406.1 hypothetical protein [Chromobacterium amazonense]